MNHQQFIKTAFDEANITIQSLDIKTYPEETIVVVKVDVENLVVATELGNNLDRNLAEQGFKGFVVIREVDKKAASERSRVQKGVADPRASDLANLLNARSRTSLVQPSLMYVPDAAHNILTVLTTRHHLIFGRRGAGKTALMAEAKSRVEETGYLSAWINLQTYRLEPAERAFLWVSLALCELMQKYCISKNITPLCVQYYQSNKGRYR